LPTKFKIGGYEIDILGGAKRKRKLFLDNVEIKIKNCPTLVKTCKMS
jgi:hypothetical protein